MALYHKWDVKNDFSYVLIFFSLISEGLSGVQGERNFIKDIFSKNLLLYTFINQGFIWYIRNDLHFATLRDFIKRIEIVT